MPSRQRQTADAIATAFNTMDIATIISLRSPTCLRQILPASLAYPPQTNAQYEAQLQAMSSIFSAFKITVDDVIEDVEQRKIAMFVRAEGQTPIGVYNNQYVWRMEFDEAGEKVDMWTEFVDVGMVRDFYPRLVGEMKRRAEEAERKESGGG
ncbi:hypothetical protein K505DRAFT_378830 [Melanomma pulvis-pyrius CBS 109.77]|uniref:SnoaL-like domain-containing protein n=1 Tax=Melanomma pulvis-pyrius CBS 109.77 TaxID=1314802 RepID=A0A6A6WXB6_9PLEO|nr:hypothetical protein K505DRAFT_378830 [Melanomma pulvis-pyrius CBS 109.77]